ncbi:potassium channel protein [Paenibacillus macerans]|uniref:TrkA-N domain protein n=1 Tax=Paenibacillus macerans TaxID=44252 RepID=A0A090Y950_PAEMA|nr:potassium channel family protein [Paenibacillus macerans]KFM94352.1 trkA-N domain protein [Paenibacillus macerans]MCY7560185.1 ion channel [Paenibacillus macerans]MEC0149836.1 ion channel [Paenibacillus macerans]SUD25539.1 Ion transport 2 domain-containing protein [Paenibacillus macerans]
MHFLLRITARLMRLRKTSLAILIVLFVTLSATIAYGLEPATFGTWFNALYWVLTTMATVGYGDFFAETVPGKVFTIFLYIFGIGLLSLVIGKVIDSIGSLQRQRGAGALSFRGENHIILINWSKKAQAAVEEILSYSPGNRIVLVDEIGQHPLAHMHQVHFVSGDPAADETLLKAGIGKAKAAIIFADARIDEFSLIDGKSLLIASSIERLAPHIHTTVEITQEKNIQNFRHVQVNEFVLSHDAISRLAVRSALQAGNSELIRQLLSRQHGDDIYEVRAKAEWKTYREAFDDLLSQGATLLADRGDLGINRKLDQPIPAEARLYIVSDEATYRRISGA